MRMTFSYLILAALIISTLCLPGTSSAGSLKSFDFGTFKELDKKAQSIWDSVVKEKGSSQAALQALYLKNGPANTRIQELHFEVTQLIDSSGFDTADLPRIKYQMSGLMRFVLVNISIHYGKYLPGNVKQLNLGWASTFKSSPDERTVRMLLVKCAVSPISQLDSDMCLKNYGFAMNVLARKAGRATLLSNMSDRGLTGEVKNPMSLCDSILNKKALSEGLRMQLYFLGYMLFSDDQNNEFMGAVEKCKAYQPPSEQQFEISLLPAQYNDLKDVADSYFPNDDVK